MVKMDKKQLEIELDTAYDFICSLEDGKDCLSMLSLFTLEDWEHCGYCY